MVLPTERVKSPLSLVGTAVSEVKLNSRVKDEIDVKKMAGLDVEVKKTTGSVVSIVLLEVVEGMGSRMTVSVLVMTSVTRTVVETVLEPVLDEVVVDAAATVRVEGSKCFAPGRFAMTGTDPRCPPRGSRIFAFFERVLMVSPATLEMHTSDGLQPGPAQQKLALRPARKRKKK